MANFFRKLFNIVKTKKSEIVMTAELEHLCQFENALDNLLKQDKYIARSDYKDLRDENSARSDLQSGRIEYKHL